MRGSRLLFVKGICACRDLRNTDSRRHVCRCVACVRSDARGRYIENPVYNIDESQAIEFDKKFEPKELVVGTPSQKRFDRIVAMRRKA